MGLCMGFLLLCSINAYGQTTVQICSGAGLSFTNGAPNGTTFTWTVQTSNSNLSNVNPNGTPNVEQSVNDVGARITNNTNVPQDVVFNVTASNTLYNTTLTVRVIPTPKLTNVTTTAICSGSAFSFPLTASTGGGTTIDWVRTTANSPGVAPTSSAGTGNISEAIITNTTPSSPTTTVYTVTLSATGCSNVQPINVTVNPLPTLNTVTIPDVCSGGAAVSFTATSSQSPNVTFTWIRNTVVGNGPASGNAGINEVLTNITTAPVAVTYEYTLDNSVTGCTNVQNVTTNVKPTPALTNIASAQSSVCSGQSVTFTALSSLTGTSFNYSRSALPNINPNAVNSNTASINEPITNSSTAPITVHYIYTLTKSNCSVVEDIPVIVNPLPTLSSTLTATGICSGNPFNYAATSAQSPNVNFAWTQATNPGINGGSTPSGTGDISGQTLNNSTNATLTVFYTYTLTNTSNSCSNTQNVSVQVFPIPTVTGYALSVCNQNGFVTVPPTAPNGTTYVWGTPTVSNALLTGVNAQATAVPYVSEAMFQNNGPQATADYLVTPSLGGCPGSPFHIIVTVGTGTPGTVDMTTTAGTLTPAAICSGTPFVLQATSTTAVSYQWTRLAVTGITEAGTSSNSAYINEVLTNSTTALATTFYYYTVTAANQCSNAYVVNARVNPGTALSSTTTPTPVCSSTPFVYTPLSNTAGTTFNWLRQPVAGIQNSTGTGTTNGTTSFTESLINQTDNPIAVTYQIDLATAATPACTSTSFVVVTINPTPKLVSLAITAVCSGSALTYTAQSNTSGTLFNWTRAASPSISTPVFSGVTSINEILDNTTLSPATVNYVFALTANGCSNSQTVTGTVNPLPSVTNKTAVICSGSAFDVTPAAGTVPTGTQYTWAITPGVITGGSAQASQNIISQTLANLTPSSANAFYAVTPTANGCSGSSFAVDVTVNPIPTIASQSISAVCSGVAFVFTPTGVPSGTTYTWAAPPTLTPIASISGGSAQFTTTTISQTLTSSNNAAASALYTIVPTANTCVGNTFTLTVPVNPVPIVSPLTTSICSGFSFTATVPTVPAGTTYTWAAPVNNPAVSVVGASQETTPVSFISQTLTSPVSTVVTTTYTVSPVSGSCAGPTFPVTVTVNPSTQLSSSLTPSAICSAGTFSYIPTSATSGTSFSWGRAFVAGISNTPGANAGNPLEVITNVTANPITVTYVYALSTAAGCTNSQSVTVVVNPTPKMNISLTPADVCSGNLFTYTPSSATAGTTFTWDRASVTGINNAPVTGANGSVNENLVNIILSPVQVTYAYLLTANGCSNNESVLVNINPVPVAASQALSICSNATFTVTPTGVPSNTQYTWAAPVSNPSFVVTNGSAQGTPQTNISQALINNTTAPGDLVYRPVPTASGCSGQPFTVTVTVNPIPNAGPVTLTAICSGSTFNYTPAGLPAGTVFNWNSPTITPTAGLTGGGPGALQTSISQTLSSSNNIANNAVYTVTPLANGCQGSTFQVTVPVNPVPFVGVQNVDLCSGNSFTVSPTAVPAGTTYTWGTPASTPFGSVSGATLQSTPVASVSQLLTSSSNVAVQTVYNVIPATSSCTGNAFTITVAVNPSTALSSGLTPAAICSNTVFNYTPTSNTPSTSIFSWTRAAVSGISTPARSNSGNPNETLVNGTASPISVVYSYTLSTTAGCYNQQNVTVVVNPTPVLNPQTINAVCSGVNFFNYTPTSATAGTTFTWNRLAVTSINNAAASGPGDPNELLVNLSLNVIPVTYDYTLQANGCSNTQSIVVNVNPIPVVNDQTATICSNASFAITPVNVPAGTQYSWAAAVSTPTNVVTGGNAAASQNNINGTLTNATISAATGRYTVVPTANGCSGNSFSVTVTVNPIPVANNQTLSAVCSGTPFSYTPANIPVNTKYSWGAPALTPLQGLTGGGAASVQNSISQTLSSTNNVSNTAVYIVTPVADGCTGSTFQVTVPVNPVPVVTNQSLAICSGTSFLVSPTAVPVGTQYTWGTPVHTPVGSVTGSSAQGIPQSTISQLLNNTTTAAVQTVYTVTPAVNGCSGNNFTITVGVNPGTQLNTSVTPPAVCSNTLFSYPAASNTPGTTFQWTRAVVGGISTPARSGTNDPLEILTNITTDALTVTYAYTLSTPAGCTNNQTVSVRVNPTPSLTSLLNPAAICSGTQFNYNPTATMAGTSFAWTRNSVALISNPSTSGTNNPAEFLVNSSVSTANTFYDYTMTASGCSNTQRVTVTVNPTPTITNQTTATCSNVAFNYSPTTVPVNTSYTWTAPTINPVGSISGGSAEPSGQPGITQLLINQTLNAANARYRVTPTAGACTGADFFVDVTLNPAATIGNQTLAAICSGTAFTYTPSNVPANTVYTWSNPVLNPANGLTGGSAEAIAKTSISQTLSSSNNVVNNAVYVVTPTTNGCLGQTFNLSVFVNPTPSVANMKDTICTGSSFSLTAASPVPSNTLYTWTMPLTFPFGSIVGGTAQPSPAPTISQTLFNTTTAPAQAVYTVTPQASGCVGNSFTLNMVVGAVLPAIPNQAATVCSGAAFNATPGNQPPNTTYTWGTPTVSPTGSVTGISAASTPQTVVSQLLDNLITTNSTVVYTVTAKNSGCISNNFTATITVLPVPRTFVTGKPEICRYPFDTLSISFTGASPWGFTYFDGTTNTPHVITGVTTSPYQLIVPSSPNASRTLSFLNASHNGCTNNKDTVYFAQIINSLPVGVIHSLHGTYICNNIMDTMFVTSPEVLTYQWTRNGTTIAGAVDDSIATNVPGRYNVMMTNQFGCRDTASVFQPKIYIPQPVLRLTYDTYCINTLMSITNMTDTNLIGPTAWTWTFDNGASSGSQTGFHTSVTFATGGDHHIKLTAKQLYCPAYPTSIDTTVNIMFPIAGVTMPSISAYKGQSTPVSVRSLPGYKYRWTPPFGINNPDSSNTFFNNQNTQQYVINLISPAGCVTRDSLLVRVFDDKLVEIMIPKSFTPNGDGINDILYPYLSGIKEFKYFKIYNRFNQLMFETKNHDVGWNGSVNGTPQPMAIYIWVAVGVALDGSMVERKGQVLLLR